MYAPVFGGSVGSVFHTVLFPQGYPLFMGPGRYCGSKGASREPSTLWPRSATSLISIHVVTISETHHSLYFVAGHLLADSKLLLPWKVSANAWRRRQ